MVEYQDVLERRLQRPLDASDQQLPRVGVPAAGTGHRLPRATRRRGEAARAKKVPAEVGLHPSTVRRYIRRGLLKAWRRGGDART
jgi:hypothetical protein